MRPIPLIVQPLPPGSTSTPIATSTPLATAPATDTPVPTSTATPLGTPHVIIASIHFDGEEPRFEGDEYAEITNEGTAPQDLQGWRLNAGDPGQDFVFPSFDLVPDQVCRVYTDEVHPEWCGFSFGSGTALWANSGDCGYLYDSGGTLVSEYCYP